MHLYLDCPGCGRFLKVNQQFAGRIVRCPRCGEAYRAPDRDDAQPRRNRSALEDVSAEELHVPCERCGLLVRASEGGGPVTCSNCQKTSLQEVFPIADSGLAGAVFAAPDALSPATGLAPATDPASLPDVPASPPSIPAVTDSQCPECTEPMAADAVVCIVCGFNRATGKRLKTVTQRIARRWDTGNFPLPARLSVFVGLVALAVACFIPALDRNDPEMVALGVSIPLVGALLGGLLLGTFHRVTVTTDPQGTPILVQNGWIYFIPSSRFILDLTDFRTIRLTHRESSPGPLGLLLAVGLCLLGGLPAIIWYIHVLNGSLFTLEVVSRPGRHGETLLEPFLVYHGRSERMARGMGDALEQIADLRYG
jgi:DNA-directed RNA polymerase subunit M/transcription elongation factor TFIIS